MLDNSIALYQDGGTDQFNSESKFGIVVINVSGQDTKEASNITSQTWNGEDGEEIYIPSGGVVFKAYDTTLTLGVKDGMISGESKTAREIKDLFITYIKNKLWKVYIYHTKATLNGCHVVKVEDDDYGNDWLTFKLTLKVSKP